MHTHNTQMYTLHTDTLVAPPPRRYPDVLWLVAIHLIMTGLTPVISILSMTYYYG